MYYLYVDDLIETPGLLTKAHHYGFKRIRVEVGLRVWSALYILYYIYWKCFIYILWKEDDRHRIVRIKNWIISIFFCKCWDDSTTKIWLNIPDLRFLHNYFCCCLFMFREFQCVFVVIHINIFVRKKIASELRATAPVSRARRRRVPVSSMTMLTMTMTMMMRVRLQVCSCLAERAAGEGGAAGAGRRA